MKLTIDTAHAAIEIKAGAALVAGVSLVSDAIPLPLVQTNSTNVDCHDVEADVVAADFYRFCLRPCQ